MDLRRSIIGTSIALLSTCSIVRAQSSGVFIEGHRVGPVGPATRQNNLPCISTGGVAYNESTNLKMIVDIPDKETFIWGTCEEYPGECQCDWKVPYDSWYCWAHGLTEHLEARFEKNHIHENPSKHEARFQLTISSNRRLSVVPIQSDFPKQDTRKMVLAIKSISGDRELSFPKNAIALQSKIDHLNKEYLHKYGTTVQASAGPVKEQTIEVAIWPNEIDLGEKIPIPPIPKVTNQTVEIPIQLRPVEPDTGFSTPPRYNINVEINGHKTTAVFTPDDLNDGNPPHTSCGKELLDKLGIPLTVKPTHITDELVPVQPTENTETVQPNEVTEKWLGPQKHVIERLWRTTVDLNVGGIVRHHFPIEVEENNYWTSTLRRSGLAPQDSFLLGSDFFTPGTVKVTTQPLKLAFTGQITDNDPAGTPDWVQALSTDYENLIAQETPEIQNQIRLAKCDYENDVPQWRQEEAMTRLCASRSKAIVPLLIKRLYQAGQAGLGEQLVRNDTLEPTIVAVTGQKVEGGPCWYRPEKMILAAQDLAQWWQKNKDTFAFPTNVSRLFTPDRFHRPIEQQKQLSNQ